MLSYACLIWALQAERLELLSSSPGLARLSIPADWVGSSGGQVLYEAAAFLSALATRP